MSLTYDAPTETGETTDHTDTYHGRFAELVRDERVAGVPVEANETGWRMALAKLAALVETG